SRSPGRPAPAPPGVLHSRDRWSSQPGRGRGMADPSHRHAKINGLDVHYAAAAQGPLVVLLHGFPHLWFSCRHQIGPIAAAGVRVVAPDMRGMGETSGPDDPREYGVDRIV